MLFVDFMDMLLIRLVDMGFKVMFSDPHCEYKGPAGRCAEI